MIRTMCPMGFSRQDSAAYLAAQLAKGFSQALQILDARRQNQYAVLVCLPGPGA